MKDLLVVILIGGAIVFGINRCTKSEWYQAGERERAEQEKRDRTPHVIREADDCKVYAWKDGSDTYHYFTKCPNSTVQTDRTYTESCGKNCTRKKVESITTTSN
ncbi:hypothetical protein [Burkholderia vietnamiensis]|uniref:hypothetical protein n=1 Tax=Burkholderia vietnamiensis TaxID=60552 RepID=UPI001CAD68C7|nr:hypothetical protein [Burkholderia vietnamiensis]CAG9229396.1 conserved hypothetical protein [Burkholderia vietnamiensis]HDR9086273.1 hypothetical protein [Burkholderia vietnamiensis]